MLRTLGGATTPTCKVAAALSSPWSTGNGQYGNTVQLTVTNTAAAAVPVPWTLNVTNAAYKGIPQVCSAVLHEVQGCRRRLLQGQAPGGAQQLQWRWRQFCRALGTCQQVQVLGMHRNIWACFPLHWHICRPPPPTHTQTGCARGPCMPAQAAGSQSWHLECRPLPWTAPEGCCAQAWNWDTTFSGTTVSGVASLTWEALAANSGNAVTVGGSFVSTSQNFAPTSATLNGKACALA